MNLPASPLKMSNHQNLSSCWWSSLWHQSFSRIFFVIVSFPFWVNLGGTFMIDSSVSRKNITNLRTTSGLRWKYERLRIVSGEPISDDFIERLTKSRSSFSKTLTACSEPRSFPSTLKTVDSFECPRKIDRCDIGGIFWSKNISILFQTNRQKHILITLINNNVPGRGSPTVSQNEHRSNQNFRQARKFCYFRFRKRYMQKLFE